MKYISLVCATLVFFVSTLFAQNPPLKIAVYSFTPPFIMQGGNQELYGFDISMMQYICGVLKRPCQFQPMSFFDILTAVESGQVDVGVSTLTVTTERASRVNFSKPYLISQGRLLGSPKLTSKLTNQAFDLNQLQHYSIGILRGSSFMMALKAFGLDKQIQEFDDSPSMIQALQNDRINLVLIDAPSAMYWQMTTSKVLRAVGSPLNLGAGFAIAVNRNNPVLLNQINQALTEYQSSEAFKQDYDNYIAHF